MLLCNIVRSIFTYYVFSIINQQSQHISLGAHYGVLALSEFSGMLPEPLPV